MLTGINYSPPLYFLINFICQSFLPTSIELLRIQSLFWVLIGVTISFVLTRNLFGSLPALLATSLVVAQSNLLLSQSLEARHYTMFLACSAFVIYTQMKSTIDPNNFKKDYWCSLVTYFCAKYTTLALFFRHLQALHI